MVGRGCGDRGLACELRAPIDVERSGRIGFPVGVVTPAVEGILGGQVDQRDAQGCRGLGDPAGAVAINAKGSIGCPLGAIDVSEGCSVDDDVGAKRRQGCQDIRNRLEVEIGTSQPDNVKTVGGAFRQGARELSASADHDHAHGAYSVAENVCGRSWGDTVQIASQVRQRLAFPWQY